MGRIAQKPVVLPSEMTVHIADGWVVLKGPKGELKQRILPGLRVEKKENKLFIVPDQEKRLEPARVKAAQGLLRRLVWNAIEGIKTGFEKKLEIRGVGYRAAVEKNKLILSLGFSHPVIYTIPEGVSVSVEKQAFLTVRGTDKKKVGEVAAAIRRLKPPEVYKGTGIRYLGEMVSQKAGKAGSVK